MLTYLPVPLLLLTVSLLGRGVSCDNSTLPPQSFSHHTVLDRGGLVHLWWSPGDKGIVFKLEVATHGYIALGFSPSGGMHGSDIALAWVDSSGGVHLSDRHSVGNNAPYMDPSQDLELHSGYENDTHTVIQFYRLWDTCDPDDLVLGTDTVRLIWAYHSEDPADNNHIMYHSLTQRGQRSIFLAEPPQPKRPVESHHKTWDLRADNLLLPADDHTHYWCRIHRAPELDTKHHMVALEPLIQPGHESYVHHMVLYECHIPDEVVDAAGATTADWFQRHVDQPGEPCYSPNMPAEWSFCLATNAWAWAVGSEGEWLPDHTGMSLGEQWGGASYFMLETHYDNPAYHAPLIDSSGLRITYTDHLRTYDTGMLLVGSEVNFLQFIPPKQKEFTSIGLCSSDCTQAGIPESGIKIISGILHSHLAGRKMRLRHIRNGIELPVVLEDNHYDFNFQASRVPQSETVVYPGDQLVLECNYDTSARDQPTFGGLSTREEMCLVFILYYPKTQLADCRSLTDLNTLTSALGIGDFYGNSFERLVEFMKDIGDETNAGLDGSQNSLASLLDSLARETGHRLPSLPKRRPSSAPLTEAELLKKPFYTVATPEPELQVPQLHNSNYRTLLIDLLVKVRIKSPEILHNKTIGELFASLDWVSKGPDINRALVQGEHNSLCLAHGRKPLIPYQTTTLAAFKPLEPALGRKDCSIRGPYPSQALPSTDNLLRQPLKASGGAKPCLSVSGISIICYGVFTVFYRY